MNPISRYFRTRSLKKTIARMNGQIEFLKGQQKAASIEQLKLEKAVGRAEQELWRVDGSAAIERMGKEPTFGPAVEKIGEAVKVVTLKFRK